MPGSEASDTAHDAVQRLAPSLRRFARALAADRDEAAADQIVHEAIDRLRRRTESASHLRAALYAGIVHIHRGRRLPAPHELQSARAGRGGVAQQIERLPLDQREVLLLVVLEQLSYDEVATILSLPRSSIVARLARARAALSLAEETSARPAYLRVVK